ncbi:hypothetical protein CA85_31540 [Allorhodopirellula solitaria]|uniref:Uncharacterized protein n=1 Tax=Allorhodopirellula solitaria TaxID=2527987 RepID=A0A5C5XUG5_9BACT|nr:hypothetical protein CA85_31540 [Allorhodopirellula solitaria]
MEHIEGFLGQVEHASSNLKAEFAPLASLCIALPCPDSLPQIPALGL